jgi:hypothetical protein
MDACNLDSNEFICIADCPIPVQLVLLLIAFSQNRAYCVKASNIFVVLHLINILWLLRLLVDVQEQGYKPYLASIKCMTRKIYQ